MDLQPALDQLGLIATVEAWPAGELSRPHLFGDRSALRADLLAHAPALP